MKITVGELRSLIREAALTAQAARGAGLALYAKDTGDTVQLALYKHKIFRDALTRALEGSFSISLEEGPDSLKAQAALYLTPEVVGAIYATKAGEFYVVERVAAQQGYGPLLYDLVASKGPITPDLEKTSSEARGVWSYYKNTRAKGKGADVSIIKKLGLHEDPEMDMAVKLKPAALAKASAEMESLVGVHDMSMKMLAADLVNRQVVVADKGSVVSALEGVFGMAVYRLLDASV